MALSFTQSLREMNTRKSFRGKARSERKTDSLTAIYESIVWTSGILNAPTTV
jgi:hypothetical protein